MTCYGESYGAVMATKTAPGMVFRHKGPTAPLYGGNQPNPEAVMANSYGGMAQPQHISSIVRRIAAAIIVSCPKCGRPRLYGHACGHCGDPEPEAAVAPARMQPPESTHTALYGHLWACTGHVSEEAP